MARALPAWLSGYRREWLRADVVAGLVIWSVVVPQAVAYAQIAGLPPQAGLMAAPGALIAYALLGTSRSLVVSATTATSALSAATIGPLAGSDAAKFAVLSAALALVTGVVLVIGGALRLGAISDFVSTPVMTGMLFGLGLTIMAGQLPKALGLEDGSGTFFPRVWDIVSHLGDAHALTVIVGAASVAGLVLFRRLPIPATLLVLVAAIVVSAALGLPGHGVAVVGKIPAGLPDFAWPSLNGTELQTLLPAAFGVLILSTEAVGVSRALADKHGYQVDPNRDLSAMGVSNVVAGLSSGFVQSGGASQTAAADDAGGRTQLATLITAALVLLTGAFLAPLFRDLPEATLAAIVIVAVASFLRVGELRRFARVRRSAIVLALLAVAGVLLLGVLRGLLVAAALSLFLVIRRLSRPPVTVVARAPLRVRVEGGLFYANAVAVKDRIVALADGQPVEVDLGSSWELDVQAADMLRDLSQRVPLRLVDVEPAAAALLARAGLGALLDQNGENAADGSASG
ncbi:MAG TPA: SulP family inorganic anion transporter [Solirubrobacter sp.]|nr:SulP family inorganic anion transporter [Solirubrobacter sp.]